MRETYHGRIGAFLYKGIIIGVVVVVGIITPLSPVAATPVSKADMVAKGEGVADATPLPAADTTPPEVTLNVQEGTVRNTVKAELAIIDAQPKTAFIEVVHADGSPFTPRLLTESNAAASSIMLRWKTNDLPDGSSYLIRYGATDQAGNTTKDQAVRVTIDNKTPFATLSKTPDYRTIGGSISHHDATIAITVDDATSTMAPTIAESPDDEGNYIWTAVVPASIADGLHHFGIKASRTIPSQQPDAEPMVYVSTPITEQLTVVTPPPPTPVEPPTPVQAAPLSFRDEIGQFVAPILPVAPITPITRLYGVTVGDLTSANVNSTPKAIASASSRDTSVLGAKAIVDADATPIAASESGWVLMGIAWYWWMIITVGATIGATMAIRTYHRQNTNASSFIHAESV